MFQFIQTTMLAGAIALAAATQAADTTGKIKLLIIEGVSNHDWHHRLALVKEILAKDGSFDVEVSVTPQAADDPAWQTWRPDFSKHTVVLSMDGGIRQGPGVREHLRPRLGGPEGPERDEMCGISNPHATRAEMAGQPRSGRFRAGGFSSSR